MAGRIGVVTLEGVSTGTALKTLLQLVAASNHAIKVVEVAIGFTGTTNTNTPIKVQLTRQTTAGTMTPATIVKGDDSVSHTFDTSAQHTATAEPTAGDVLGVFAVHPQTSLVYHPPSDAPLIVGEGDRLGLVVTAADSVSCHCHIKFEE